MLEENKKKENIRGGEVFEADQIAGRVDQVVRDSVESD